MFTPVPYPLCLPLPLFYFFIFVRISAVDLGLNPIHDLQTLSLVTFAEILTIAGLALDLRIKSPETQENPIRMLLPLLLYGSAASSSSWWLLVGASSVKIIDSISLAVAVGFLR